MMIQGRCIQKILCFGFLALVLTCQSASQWSADPTQNLIVGYGLLPELASDSAGGCYITYEQNLSYPRHLILERLDRYGHKPWGNGKQIMGLLPEQKYAQIKEDGRNGVIVSYNDIELTGTPDSPAVTFRLRVQRIDSSGNFLWGVDGVRASLSETNQDNQAVVSDENGGCIVAWMDTMSTLRIQRIDNFGIRTWGDSGIVIANDGTGRPLMVIDLAGGIIVTWKYQKFQRINNAGQKVWADSGITISGGASTIRIETNKVARILGRNYLGVRNGQLLFTVRLQSIDILGTILWDSSGVIIDTANTNSYPLMSFTVQNGYSTIAWPRYDSGVWDIHTQIVRGDGSIKFQYGGIPISRTVSQKNVTDVLSSDSSTSVYVWADERSVRSTYTQRLDTIGNQLWSTSDIRVATPAFSDESCVADGKGGFIIVGARENFSIRAQQVSIMGHLGEIITGVSSDDLSNQPHEFRLYQNFPNPFNPSTTFKYTLPRLSYVTLKVYNILGQEIATLIDGMQEAGYQSVDFDASKLSSGVYFYRLQAGTYVAVKKMVVLK